MDLPTCSRSRWRLLALALLIGAVSTVGLLSAQPVGAALAASNRVPNLSHPLVGCAPCISAVTPADGSTATIDQDGKVTMSFTAQLTNPFAKFVFILDNTQIDSGQIQITSTDPMQPTGQYRATLSAGEHKAFVQVYDSNGPAAAIGWKFTVPQAPPPTPTSTKATANNGSGGSGGGDSSSGGLTPKTLSIILFSIAGVGLLVVVFIAGMWYGGRRALRNEP
jgi:hypothetical protein